jgi:outer membrane cobalamin receptor
MKKQLFRQVFYLGLLFFVTVPALATAPDSDSVRYHFNPIVVTATKAAGAQRDLAASISVIGPTQLQQIPSQAVLDLVSAYVPGLYLTEWSVMGYGVAGKAAGKLAVRGIGGTADTHVMILRNGRPDFMGLMGCTIADEFATDGVERIEVVRGPASFLYGSNASAGVINIISQKMEREGFQTRFKTGYGAFNTQKYSVQHGAKLGKVEYNITTARRSTDGHRTDGENKYEGNFFTGHIGYQLNPKTSVEANASMADLYLFDPGLITTPKTDDWYDILRWGGDVTLTHESRFGESYLKWHGNFGKHKFADGWRSADQMIGLMAYHNIRLTDGNTTTVGFDIKQYGGHAEGSIDYTEEKIVEYAPYVHIQQLLLRRLIASTGFRLEHHELYGTVAIPKLGLVAHITETNALRFALSKGFRSPSIRELYLFPSHNEDLKPDEVWNIELGYSQQIGRSLHIDATVFHIEGDNLIALTKRVSGPGYQLTNINQVENNGFEFELSWIPLNRFELGVSLTGMDMKNQIPNMPKKKMTTFASWQVSKLTLSGTLMWVMDWVGKDNATPLPNIYPMDDYAVADLLATIQVFNALGLQLSLKNVLDTDYQAMYGYPMPGRTLETEINYTF